MAIKRTTIVSLRLPIIDLDEYEILVDKKLFNSVSEAIRECGSKGRLLLNYKDVLKDPIKKKEFFEKLDSTLKNEQIFEYLVTLTDTELKGIYEAIQIVQEKRSIHGGS